MVMFLVANGFFHVRNPAKAIEDARGALVLGELGCGTGRSADLSAGS
jgi:hypothetical protein